MNKRVKTILSEFDIIISGAFLITTITIVIMNVFLRYFFRTGISWTEEIATTSFIWSVFIGAAAAYRHHIHIGIDMITKLFNAQLQRIILILVHLMMVVINGYITYLSVIFVQKNTIKTTPVLRLPSAVENLSITVGFGIITLYALIFLIQSLTKKELLPTQSHGGIEP